MTVSDGGGSSEAFGRILIEYSSISILNGEYKDFPELDGGLVAATENYVLIGAVCIGTAAGVRLVIHEREPDGPVDDGIAWESDGVVTTTFTLPPFFMVGDSSARGGDVVDWALQDVLDLEEGTYTFHVRAKGLLDSREKIVYNHDPIELERNKPTEDLIQQFRIDVWSARTD